MLSTLFKPSSSSSSSLSVVNELRSCRRMTSSLTRRSDSGSTRVLSSTRRRRHQRSANTSDGLYTRTTFQTFKGHDPQTVNPVVCFATVRSDRRGETKFPRNEQEMKMAADQLRQTRCRVSRKRLRLSVLSAAWMTAIHLSLTVVISILLMQQEEEEQRKKSCSRVGTERRKRTYESPPEKSDSVGRSSLRAQKDVIMIKL
ncbi:hypothetical protein F2P81_008423 [Scophthalmus maximus]|uniref:Transmembrane protein n=1 Tax=Scophthalmus maximus TaxID=52904 RepID=A0A6A4T786_SCOMX|nr:hypothetical protein F2P81_008423 [Scophthalmus maximus]